MYQAVFTDCTPSVFKGTVATLWAGTRCFVGGRDQCNISRWQLWPLLLGLMHWSPECTKAMLNGAHDAMSSSMNCLSICSEALVAAVPAPEVTDEVYAAQ